MKNLELLPAVDVKQDQAVRLVQGELSAQTNYGSPLDAALDFQNAGAEWIHLVDLDAAFGTGSNHQLLADVIGQLDIKVELSGVRIVTGKHQRGKKTLLSLTLVSYCGGASLASVS